MRTLHVLYHPAISQQAGLLYIHERSAVGFPTALVYSLQALISFACPSHVLCIILLKLRSAQDRGSNSNGRRDPFSSWRLNLSHSLYELTIKHKYNYDTPWGVSWQPSSS